MAPFDETLSTERIIIFALAAVFADVLRLSPSLTLVTALGAVLCFATSGAVVLAAIRKQRT